MCTYNASDYLSEMLWSIENQTFKDFTLYIFNDGSTDDTANVIAEFSERIPIKVKHSEGIHNIGTVKNFVVNMALKDNPKLLQMTDHDDLLEPTMLERMVKEIEGKKVDFVVCNGRMFGEGNDDIKNKETTESKIIKDNCFVSWAMFKASVLRDFNYRVGMKHFEDWDLYIRLIKAKKTYSIIKDQLYNYRMHDNQFHKITDKDFYKHRRNLWEIHDILQ